MGSFLRHRVLEKPISERHFQLQDHRRYIINYQIINYRKENPITSPKLKLLSIGFPLFTWNQNPQCVSAKRVSEGFFKSMYIGGAVEMVFEVNQELVLNINM